MKARWNPKHRYAHIICCITQTRSAMTINQNQIVECKPFLIISLSSSCHSPRIILKFMSIIKRSTRQRCSQMLHINQLQPADDLPMTCHLEPRPAISKGNIIIKGEICLCKFAHLVNRTAAFAESLRCAIMQHINEIIKRNTEVRRKCRWWGNGISRGSNVYFSAFTKLTMNPFFVRMPRQTSVSR